MSEMKALQISERLNHTQHEIFAFEMVILLAYLWLDNNFAITEKIWNFPKTIMQLTLTFLIDKPESKSQFKIQAPNQKSEI